MQEKMASVANATVRKGDSCGLPPRKNGAGATFVPYGRADKETENPEIRGKDRRKSVQKYQIVGFDQNGALLRTEVCAKGRVRNFARKSCKKVLILSDACGIVWINLKNLNDCPRGKMPNARAFSSLSRCQFRRNWRKWMGFVKKLFFSLAFFASSGYTSLINNLLSKVLRNNLL